MGRWSHLDSDEERLPSGMQRIGYDADTQTYSFRDTDGSIWEGPSGARYGQLTRISGPSARPSQFDNGDDDDDDNAGLYQPAERPSWRAEMMPLLNFFVIIGLFLIFIFWFIGGTKKTGPPPVVCPEATSPYFVQHGDTCWQIAEENHVSVQDLLESNDGLDCDKLSVGGTVCVPSK